ncbi:MAG: TonB-dependent receptor [Tannerellaceae bacterium]|jgi:TonB-linked SusC/RagA family outer membrane protein|nr:TonB-dependent receptor [Tannerellaceae bacterium]
MNKIINSMIMSSFRKALLLICVLCLPFFLFAQGGRRIAGTIVDAQGETIIGANISVKGTTKGIISDMDGKFALDVNPNDVLVITYVGFATQEIPVRNQQQIKVTLVENENVLSDVVVVGYGTQKKATLTGAVSALTNEELIKTKTGNIQNALMGRMTGVKVNQKSSEPGTFNTDFNIRGMGRPLIVIDGVPRDNMARLDENEIESVSVLKDASAAVYGSRAANGVVLITTKKGGGKKKFSFEYNNYVGVQNMMLNAELMDATQYMRMSNEKAANNGSATTAAMLPYQPSHFAEYENGTKTSTDWLAAIVKDNPLVQSHSFGASGSTDKIDYYVNMGYFDQEGWFKSGTLWYNRFNLRSNVTARLTNRLKAEVFLNLSTDQRHQQPEGTWRVMSRGVFGAPPIYPEYVDNDPNKPHSSNPVMLTRAESGYNWNKERIAQTNLALEYQIPGIDGLTARGMYSYDYDEGEWKIFRHAYTTYEANGTPNINTYNPMSRLWVGEEKSLLQLSLNYNKTFNKVHTVGASLVYEESDRQADNFGAERAVVLTSVDQLFAASRTGEMTYQLTGRVDWRDADQTTEARETLLHYANKGFIGRFTYDYESKYLAEFSFRYDGSSRFAPGHQWGFFPVVSAGWRISEEGFIKDGISFINNLKLRASWGQTGDEGTSSYQYLTGYNYAANYYLFDNAQVNSATSRGIPNELVTWSTSTMSDIGIDVELWNGKLGLVADVYRRDQTGLLATRAEALPGVVGANMPQENLNSKRTDGFEITLSHRNKLNDFGYNLSGGIFMSRTMLKHNEEAAALDSYDKWRNKKTERWDQIIWGRDQIGQYISFDEIFQGPVITNANSYMYPGDLKFEDWNGDGIIDDNDLHPIAINTNYDGGVKPLLNYNFSIGADYKGFDLNILFQGAGMAWRNFRVGDDRDDAYAGFGARSINGFTAYYDRWHRADESNPSKWQEWVPGKYPSVYYGIGQRNFNLWESNFWAWNTAYLRLKSVELGYTFPAALLQKAKIDGLRLFVNSYNTLTFSNMPLGDPEVENGSKYPLNRTYSVGVNVKF